MKVWAYNCDNCGRTFVGPKTSDIWHVKVAKQPNQFSIEKHYCTTCIKTRRLPGLISNFKTEVSEETEES